MLALKNCNHLHGVTNCGAVNRRTKTEVAALLTMKMEYFIICLVCS